MIWRAARRVGLSSAGEVAGRAVNLVLPFAIFSVHGVDLFTDSFFLATAVAFFVYGSLTNALVNALVPELVRDARLVDVRNCLGWAAIAALLTALVVFIVATAPLSFVSTVLVGLATALMAASGLAAAPAVAVLNSDHRYGMPGLTWSLRLVPLAFYVIWWPVFPALQWLLAGLALADAGRAVILLWLARGRLSLAGVGVPMHFPVAALRLILASAVAGLTPLVARWIASFGEPGTVSLFEAGDRIYAAIASLATIGMGNVTLVYLARLSGTSEERRGWRWIVWTSMAWSLLWLSMCVFIWAMFPFVSGWLNLQSGEMVDQVREIFLALSLGIPGFVMTGVLSRRLLTAGRSELFMPITLAGLVFTACAGWPMSVWVGAAGIGATLSVAQYFVAILMAIALRRGRVGAYPGTV